MRVNLKTLLATLLICLIALVACNSLENGGNKDWVEVKIKVNQPGSSNSGNMSVSPTGTLTALIMVIPASTTIVDASTDFTNAYDGQLQSLIDNTVTLSVPLNESIQIVKKTFSSALVLEDTYDADSFTAIGSSEAFTIDGSLTSKTVTINLTATGGWSFVDGDGATGINKDVTQPAIAGELVVYNNTLFAGWSEESTSNTVERGYGQIRVAGWDGNSTWTFVDGNGADGLNWDVTKLAEHVNFALFDSKLFLAWTEFSDTTSDLRQLRVRYWDGNNWIWAGGGRGETGLNYNTAETVRLPSMAVFNSNLYLTWQEKQGSYGQIRVRKWDGTTWSFVDAGGAEGINYNTSKGTDSPHLIVFDGNLYATWVETGTTGFYQIRFAEWDGTTNWNFRDGDGTDGLNYDTSKEAHDSTTFVFGSKLYLIWAESNSSEIAQIRVKEWDKTTWRFIDGNGANGLNRSSAKEAAIPSLFEFNSKLHAAWSEPNASGKHQIRVVQWDGSSTWTFVDGDGENGLNKDSTNVAITPRAVIYNSKLYLSYMEGLFFISCDSGTCDTTKTDQIRVMQYF